jgi:hypothetical protein
MSHLDRPVSSPEIPTFSPLPKKIPSSKLQRGGPGTGTTFLLPLPLGGPGEPNDINGLGFGEAACHPPRPYLANCAKNGYLFASRLQ